MRTWTIAVVLTQATTPTPSGGASSAPTSWEVITAFIPVVAVVVAGLLGGLLGGGIGWKLARRKADVESRKTETELFDKKVDIRADLHRIDELAALKGSEQHIKHLQERNDRLHSDLTSCKQENEQLRGEKAALEGRVNELEKEVESLKLRRLPLFNPDEFRPGNGGRGGIPPGPGST